MTNEYQLDLFTPLPESKEQLDLYCEKGLAIVDATILENHAAYIVNIGRRTIFDIGKRLNEAKAVARYGTWLPFLRRVGIAERTAQEYMNVAERFASNPKVAELIPATALYALARMSDESLVQEFVARAEAGETITASDVKAVLVAEKAKETEFERLEIEFSKLGWNRVSDVPVSVAKSTGNRTFAYQSMQDKWRDAKPWQIAENELASVVESERQNWNSRHTCRCCKQVIGEPGDGGGLIEYRDTIVCRACLAEIEKINKQANPLRVSIEDGKPKHVVLGAMRFASVSDALTHCIHVNSVVRCPYCHAQSTCECEAKVKRIMSVCVEHAIDVSVKTAMQQSGNIKCFEFADGRQMLIGDAIAHIKVLVANKPAPIEALPMCQCCGNEYPEAGMEIMRAKGESFRACKTCQPMLDTLDWCDQARLESVLFVDDDSGMVRFATIDRHNIAMEYGLADWAEWVMRECEKQSSELLEALKPLIIGNCTPDAIRKEIARNQDNPDVLACLAALLLVALEPKRGIDMLTRAQAVLRGKPVLARSETPLTPATRYLQALMWYRRGVNNES